MKTVMIAGALASLQSTLVFAQGMAPGWDCNNDEPGQSGCHATWPDIKRKAPPPMINEQRPPQKKK
jgi:hypothetical protein